MANLERCAIAEEDKWDLSKIYENIDEWNADIEEVFKLVGEVLAFKGHIMDSSESLHSFYLTYDKMSRLSDLVYLYARLLCDGETTNSDYQAMKLRADKVIEDISAKLSFINSEILSADYDMILKYVQENDQLKDYAFDLEKTFRYKEHTLNEAEEEIIAKACNAFGTGQDVFYNFDNADIYLGTIINEEGIEEEVTNSNYTKLMNSKNRQVRIDAFNCMYEYFKRFKNTISASYKGQIKENFFISDVKKFNSPLEMSLYKDSISIDVYKNLIDTLHKNMPAMYDYMDIRKKMLNLDDMHMYDIYVDLIDPLQADISFEEGKNIIFEALEPLGERYLRDMEKAFDERWIDRYPNMGKKSGAYSWGCYDTYPYLLLNFNGTMDSVSTMAHELGHSMHTYYSCMNQIPINSNYPIFLAEIASTVNEVLLNDYLYRKATSKEEKIYYLTEFLDKVRTTIYRQTMFAEFEMVIHDKYANDCPITEEELYNTYYELNKLYYGEHAVSDEYIGYEWSRIPHFYNSFYVYKYATGLSAAISIASDILAGKTEIRDAYLDFLASGCSKYPLEKLASVGVDMTTPKPVEKAIEMFNTKLQELKDLI